MRLKKHLDGVDGKSFPAIVQIGVQNRYMIVGEERDNTTILTDLYGSLGSEIRALSVDAVNATDEREIVVSDVFRRVIMMRLTMYSSLRWIRLIVITIFSLARPLMGDRRSFSNCLPL